MLAPPQQTAALASVASRADHTDTLGCAISGLARDQKLHCGGITLLRKAASGPHRTRVATPAQERGLLVGISLREGHRRIARAGRHASDRIFDADDIYIRDFETDYSAEMDGSFDFFLIELRSGICGTDGRPLTPGALVAPPDQRDRRLGKLVRAMLPLVDAPESADPLQIEEAAAGITEHLCATYATAWRQRRNPIRLSPAETSRAKELLSSAVETGHSVDAIAGALNVPRSRFFRAFRETTGYSPYQWLLNQRITLARRLLHSTDLPLVEIALQCGFADQSHFTRIFRRSEGMSPAQWRRGLR